MAVRRPKAVGAMHNGPTAAECVAVCDALAAVHGRPSERKHIPRAGCELQEPHTVLDSLVRTILSQNTTDVTSQRAFTSLKAAFPDWESVRTAAPGTVEDAIRIGGLADIKAARIKVILNSLLEETGSLSLEHLRALPCEQVKAQLTQFKGVGPKTVACVLMFCMGRAEFPVDTHVWEISKQLGWVPAAATREQTYEHLNARVPDDIKYDLHVLMVQHGKVCPACAKRGTPQKRKAAAEASPCPLASFRRNRRSSGGTANQGTDVSILGGAKKESENASEDKFVSDHTTPSSCTAAEAVAVAFSFKQPKQQQDDCPSTVATVKEEPSLLAVKVEDADAAVAVRHAAATMPPAELTAAAAAAAAGACTVKPEPAEERPRTQRPRRKVLATKYR